MILSRLRIAAILAMIPAAGCATAQRSTIGNPADASPAPEAALAPSAMMQTPRTDRDLPADRSAKICLQAGAIMEEKGLPDEAIEQYEKARRFDPNSPGVARRLAVLYDRRGDFLRASAEYKLALEAKPNDPDLLNDMGYFCYERGDWQEAERWLRKAVDIDPKCRRAWVNLGMAMAQQGHSEASLAAFSKALTPAEARANLGVIEAQNGRKAEAVKALRESVKLEPDSALTRAVLVGVEAPRPAKTAPVDPTR